MGKNGYVTLEQKDDGLYMNIIPPKNGGVNASMDDIMFILDKKKVMGANLVAIKNAINKGSNESVKLNSGNAIFSTSEWMDVSVSPDGLIAVARFFPPFVGGSKFTHDEIVSELSGKNIVFGIDEKHINDFLLEREYGKKYILAIGRKPIEGTDAKITYNFETGKKPMPKIKEDGSVDFYDLDSISHVKAGDVVATLTREIPGRPGRDVYGTDINPRKVEKAHFKYDRNLKVSEDGLSLITEVSGHVTLEGDKVFVSNTFEVPGDVGFGTGNIEYDGNVMVKGNVTSGFTINATGDIEVRGIVESASLIAGGNIILGRGMQGGFQGVLKAGKSIVAKFIENVNEVEAEEKIEVGAILHSNVTCNGDIIAEGRKGLIVGGKVIACRLISAKYVGSEMGTSTSITVGVDPSVKIEAEELKHKIKELNDEKEKVSTVVALFEKKLATEDLDKAKKEMFIRTKAGMTKITEELKECMDRYNEIVERIDQSESAIIKVYGTTHYGVKINVGGCEMYIKEDEQHCGYIKQGADVRRSPL